LRLAVGEVLQLAWIAVEIVELGPGRQNVLPAAIAHGAKVAPPVVDEWNERFGECGFLVDSRAAERRLERSTRDMRGQCAEPQQVERGRHHVDGADKGAQLSCPRTTPGPRTMSGTWSVVS
jgi:hypothetical protein